MSCQKCHSAREMSVSAKCSDMFHAVRFDHDKSERHDYDGEVIRDINIGGGDYVKLNICLDCGQLQGKWPVEPITELREGIEDDEDEFED